MKVTGLHVKPFQMTRRDPTWRTSVYAATAVDALAITITTTDGLVGLGATSVAPASGHTTEGYQALLEQKLGRVLQGRDPFEIEPIMAAVHHASREASRVHTAIDIALHDLKAKALGVPVYELLGGRYRTEVPVIRMVGLQEPVLQARSAAKLVDDGYRYLKLKIGVDPVKDVERVSEVRKAVGDDVTLTVDANGGYDIKTAIHVLRRLEPFNVAMAEDPVDDLWGLAQVSHAVEMAIMADAAVPTHGDIIDAIRGQTIDLVSLKVLKLGLLKAQKMRGTCEGARIRYHLGGTATTRIVEAAALHFAVASPYNLFGCEIGEYEALDGDAVGGLQLSNGCLQVPETPGLGVELTE